MHASPRTAGQPPSAVPTWFIMKVAVEQSLSFRIGIVALSYFIPLQTAKKGQLSCTTRARAQVFLDLATAHLYCHVP